ncbi:GDSL-type esterase/lipase family protein [Nocardia sp. NPDC019395]|uniref:SGNH/GDSL hydrolase family protein n=1 Tax=Nocardia sp. NPDC019395 TaxID=3154686 RepID=UPI0033CA3E93
MRSRINKKAIAIAVSLVLAGILGAAGTVGYLTFVRSPADSPAQACKGDTPDGPVVVAAGASMTQGTLGADWVGALRAQETFDGYRFVNAGINGNTSADLRDRVGTDIVACHPDAVLILVGTNDVRAEVPVDTYRDNLAAIVGRVTSETGARVALMSLPPLGENLDAEINHKLTGYNQAIADIATRTGADYLPLHEHIADLLRQQGTPRTNFDFSFPLAFRAATEHYLFRRSWDQIAHSQNREFLVDHIHLDDRGGAIVTDLAARWLKAVAI